MGKLEITITEETSKGQVQAFRKALEVYEAGMSDTPRRLPDGKPLPQFNVDGVTKPEPAKEEQPEKSEDAKEEKPAKTKRKTRKSKKAETPEAEETKKSDASESKSDKDEPAKEESKSDDKPSVTIEQIRGLQKDVVVEHKSAIIDKLRGELGAKNLSTLDEKHYEDYYKFLEDLKNGK